LAGALKELPKNAEPLLQNLATMFVSFMASKLIRKFFTVSFTCKDDASAFTKDGRMNNITSANPIKIQYFANLSLTT
jgi:hypothetical protein